jgi:short chain dehydrogenase
MTMKSDDVGARELYDEMDVRFPNLFFSPQWSSVINPNLGSLFNMSRQVIAGMRERKFGRIINISSINGQKGPVRPDQLFGREAGEAGFTKGAGAGRRTSRRHRQRDRAKLYQHRDGAGGAERGAGKPPADNPDRPARRAGGDRTLRGISRLR